MIDLHTHSLFSDGALVVSELVRRAEDLGYRFIGITDHADRSNLDFIIPRVVRATEEINRHNRIQAVPGIELTHVPPATVGLWQQRPDNSGHGSWSCMARPLWNR